MSSGPGPAGGDNLLAGVNLGKSGKADYEALGFETQGGQTEALVRACSNMPDVL